MSFTGPLEDRLAIRELVDTYNDAIARVDAGDWGRTWSDDAEWQMMGNVLRGRDEVVAFWKKTVAQFEWVVFTAAPGSVAIDGRSGTGRVHAQEVLQPKGGATLHMHGRYDDAYVKVGNDWLFSRRVYHVLSQY